MRHQVESNGSEKQGRMRILNFMIKIGSQLAMACLLEQVITFVILRGMDSMGLVIWYTRYWPLCDQLRLDTSVQIFCDRLHAQHLGWQAGLLLSQLQIVASVDFVEDFREGVSSCRDTGARGCPLTLHACNWNEFRI